MCYFVRQGACATRRLDPIIGFLTLLLAPFRHHTAKLHVISIAGHEKKYS